tara:strand:- start:7718 stop:9379 length:1662 start_codon:yes stop_codon:yes gene_type:complete
MGLFNSTEKAYYEGNAQEYPYGGYQFISINDIVNNFMVSYVGDDKLIPKMRRLDVAFHARRVIQELSFDTFKSFKSQQIELPPTLQMILPHDYVNYTRISWVDSKGIKHPIYHTSHTSNPFQIRQDDDKEYWFESGANLIKNGNFDSQVFSQPQPNWRKAGPGSNHAWTTLTNNGKFPVYLNDIIKRDTTGTDADTLQFRHLWFRSYGSTGSRAYAAWQKIDVKDVRFIDLKATGKSAGQATSSTTGDMADYGVIRVGVTTIDPTTGLKQDGSVGWARPNGQAIAAGYTNPFHPDSPSPNYKSNSYNVLTKSGGRAFVKWDDGTESEKSIDDIDVQDLDHIWIYIQSFVPFNFAAATIPTGVGTTSMSPSSAAWTTFSVNYVDSVSITTAEEPKSLMHKNVDENSDTWDTYKSATPSENINDDYEDDVYWKYNNERYGMQPSHAQVNGSFFIDDRLGKIHFSSNISGKNVILDYISDGVATGEDMKIHKFAEEAMYKSMLYNIMCARANVGRGQLMLYKREKFAATRNAKLRLSNIKLEQLTRTLKDKSKWIK